jgi:hypothetical protein
MVILEINAENSGQNSGESPGMRRTRPPEVALFSTAAEEYDVFHLFWDALRKREEKKKKLSGQKTLVNGF